jgi:hypothetical protein
MMLFFKCLSLYGKTRKAVHYTVFHTRFVGMCMIFLHTEFHLSGPNGLIVTAAKPKCEGKVVPMLYLSTTS